MEKQEIKSPSLEEQISKFLDECMLDMYKGNDHIIARKYYRDLFNKLVPKYFCVCDEDQNDNH
jgi:hypothetical protein